MKATYTLTFASELEAPADDVWSIVGTMQGVNAELSPWLRMTTPRGAENLRIEDAPIGSLAFASWLLWLRVFPVDHHFLVLERVEPGKGFVEGSTSWSQRRWEHRRRIEPRGPSACTLTDTLTFTPRVRASGPLLVRVVEAVFRHRHRHLQQRFGVSSRGRGQDHGNATVR